MQLTYIASLLALTVSSIQAHSWLECTDYRITTDAHRNYYDSSICHGNARCGGTQLSAGFGVDTNFYFMITGSGQQQCQCAKGAANAYPAPTKKAQYRPGQRVCLAYPAKNHVEAECVSQQPDNGVKIRRTAVGAADPRGDQDYARTYNHLNGVHVNGVVDYKGFQNCPKFCENYDTALCTMCFDLESNIAPGEYIFEWLWDFQPGFLYSTCWDAQVVGSGGSPPAPNTPTAPTVTSRPATMPPSPARPTPSTPSPANGNSMGDWQQLFDSNGKSYWYNSRTGRTQWDRPTATSTPVNSRNDWQQLFDPNGRSYWYNSRTGVTQWDRPN